MNQHRLRRLIRWGVRGHWDIPRRSLGRVPRAAAQRLLGTRDRQSLVSAGARPFFGFWRLDEAMRNGTTWHVDVVLRDATIGVSGSVAEDSLALDI